MGSHDLAVIASALLLAAALVYVLAPLFGKPQRILELGAGERTKADLLLEKEAVYGAIKDAELDRQTGKLTEPDYQEMLGKLKERAASVLRQLDAHDAPKKRGKA